MLEPVATGLERPDETPLDWYPVGREAGNLRNENPGLIRSASLKRELF